MFRFCDFWLQDPEFEQIVRTAWMYDISGTPMFKVTQKFKAVKLALKKLHINKYTKLAARVEAKEEALKLIQLQLLQSPNDTLLCLQEKELKNEYKQLPLLENSGLVTKNSYQVSFGY